MDNETFFVDNYGNVINEQLSIEIADSLNTGLNHPCYLGGGRLNLSTGHGRSRYYQRVELVMQLVNLRNGRT